MLNGLAEPTRFCKIGTYEPPLMGVEFMQNVIKFENIVYSS